MRSKPALVLALLLCLIVVPPTSAQSGVESAAEIVTEESTAPGPVADPAASVAENARYLRSIDSVRLAWYGLEWNVHELARAQRLGTLDPRTAVSMGGDLLPYGMTNIDHVFDRIEPPVRFAHVHQLHVDANQELHVAMEAAEWWLTSGDLNAIDSAMVHFARFDRLINQALSELS